MTRTKLSKSVHVESVSDQPRSSGVLLHVTSLPGRYGIGDLGPAAREWIDLLSVAKQTWWQILPLTPAGAEYSPYQSYSAFAGNPLLISLDDMVEDGLLTAADVRPPRFSTEEVEYHRVAEFKGKLFALAADRFFKQRTLRNEFDLFCKAQKSWLDDYALFMSLRAHHDHRPWSEWPDILKCHDPAALKAARAELAVSILLHRFVQFVFDRQLQRLREHARLANVKILGDLPIFISAESADAWGRPHLFQLQKNHQPSAVAGVPPDLFQKKGQRWGNPLYDWPAMARDDYAWWGDRLAATLRQCDLIRLDHFRGFEACWRIPADAPDARTGRWQKGPGAALFEAFEKRFGSLPLIAEDLGMITPAVERLRDQFALPGMRILQFAFGDTAANPHLPHNYVANCVTYPGTHDNDTTLGWYRTQERKTKTHVQNYLGAVDEAAVPWAMIRAAWSSVARLAIAPLQDVMSLPSEARMNTPGTHSDNWGWRLSRFSLAKNGLEQLKSITDSFGRASRKV